MEADLPCRFGTQCLTGVRKIVSLKKPKPAARKTPSQPLPASPPAGRTGEGLCLFPFFAPLFEGEGPGVRFSLPLRVLSPASPSPENSIFQKRETCRATMAMAGLGSPAFRPSKMRAIRRCVAVRLRVGKIKRRNNRTKRIFGGFSQNRLLAGVLALQNILFCPRRNRLAGNEPLTIFPVTRSSTPEHDSEL